MHNQFEINSKYFSIDSGREYFEFFGDGGCVSCHHNKSTHTAMRNWKLFQQKINANQIFYERRFEFPSFVKFWP